MKFTGIVDNQRVEIEFKRQSDNGIQARIGDRTYQLETRAVEPGVYWFNLSNRSIELTVTPANDGYTVTVGGHRVGVEILDARTALRKATQHGHDGLVEVRAPMPGKIVKVLVAEGVEVQPQQGILVMEAMKMQNEIKAPKQGTIRKLSVTEGVAVNSGDHLVSVE